MVGVLFGGVLSDKFGRKPMVFFPSVLCNVLALIASFVNQFWAFTLFRGLVGICKTTFFLASVRLVAWLSLSFFPPFMLTFFSFFSSFSSPFLTSLHSSSLTYFLPFLLPSYLPFFSFSFFLSLLFVLLLSIDLDCLFFVVYQEAHPCQCLFYWSSMSATSIVQKLALVCGISPRCH